MSSGHRVNINTWQMDFCWFKLKWKLLKRKKECSYFLEKKLAFMWFLPSQSPRWGSMAMPSLPPLLTHIPQSPVTAAGRPRSSAMVGCGQEGEHCWGPPALDPYTQCQGPTPSVGFLYPVLGPYTQPPVQEVPANSRCRPAFSKSHRWRLHNVHQTHEKGLSLFSLMPLGTFYCYTGLHLLPSCCTLQQQSAVGAGRWRAGMSTIHPLKVCLSVGHHKHTFSFPR